MAEKRADKLYKNMEECLVKAVEIDTLGRMYIFFENGVNYLCQLHQGCVVKDESVDRLVEGCKRHNSDLSVAAKSNHTYTKIITDQK